jgi:hypothetical protein
MLWPVVNQQSSGGFCRIEQPASDQSGDQIGGFARPLESGRDLLVIMPADLAGWCVLSREPPEQAGEAESVWPGHAEDDGEPPDLRGCEGTV